MAFAINTARELLQGFRFGELFLELGWGRPAGRTIAIGDLEAKPIAALAGVVVFEVTSQSGEIPLAAARLLAHRAIRKLHHEHLLVFCDGERRQSLWSWARAEGSKLTPIPHLFTRGQTGELFLRTLAALHVDLSELDQEGRIDVLRIAEKLRMALDAERVTKKFFREYQEQHDRLLDDIHGIPDERDRRWYASVLLNRLMFVYFLQQKGFLDDGDYRYLGRKLQESRARGKDRFFSEFLSALFFAGFGKPPEERTAEERALIGEVRFLDGGLFLPHQLEIDHPDLAIPDRAFERVLGLFDSYTWHLDDTPGGKDDEISPSVLGYIFEKYINQKAFGAYYTRTEITEYLCRQTIRELVLERAGGGYDSLEELLVRLDEGQAARLLLEILPRLRVLDPACGSGAFLVAALKTLFEIYTALLGKAQVAKRGNLRHWIERAQKEHRSIHYWIKKSIITQNLYGVDIMPEAVEIARLHLFLNLASSVTTVDELEPLPNIDFNLMAGNSLVGRVRLDDEEFARAAQSDLFRKSLPELLAEKRRSIESYRGASSYADDLRALRDGIEEQRAEARKVLDDLLLTDFQSLGVQFEQATWDEKRKTDGKPIKRALTYDDIRELQPFHWAYEFDEILAQGGFDVILTNPPWEIWKPQAKEFFAEHSELVTKNAMRIEDFEKERGKLLRDPAVRRAWLAYQSRFPHLSLYFRKSPQYPNQIAIVGGKKAGTDINLYKLFLERCFNLLCPGGACGIVIPSGIYTDLGTKQLRAMLFTQTRILGLFGFENRKSIFEGVDSRFKFVTLTFKKGGPTPSFPAAFMRHHVKELAAFPRSGGLELSVALVQRLSPDSLSLMEFRSPLDITIAEKMLRFPLLGERIEGAWNAVLSAEFHMTNDSGLFKTAPGRGRLLLYEGKMIWQFDHRYEKPRYWVEESEGRKALLGRQDDTGQLLDYQQFRLAFRDIARNTDTRTLISCILPLRVFAGNKAPTALVGASGPLLGLCAIWNSFIVDWALRQKVSATVNFFYLYQLPIPRLKEGDPSFRPIVERAARLSCTDEAFAPLWEEVMGRPWSKDDGATDEATRAPLRADLDGLVAHLYGLTEDEFAHVLSTFPLVPEATRAAALEAFRRLGKTSDPELRGLLLGGEGPLVEFKSSTRWDTRNRSVNKDLQREVARTVAGFLNARGGTLLIGVDDSGTVLGLAEDYASISGKPNRDGYALLLGEVVFSTLGKDLSPCVHWSFHQSEGKDLCRVTVEPAPRPVWMQEGQEEVLWVRAGSATRRLSAREAVAYEKSRWGPGAAVEPVIAAPPLAPRSVATAARALEHTPLFKKPGPPPSEEARAPNRDSDDVLCAIRELFGRPDAREGLEHSEALQRLETDGLESHLATAARRGIVRTERGRLFLATRSIEDYRRDDLKDQIVAVADAWIEREDAVRAAARRLGFRRIGRRIREAFASAINGALRQGRLEVDRSLIRRAR